MISSMNTDRGQCMDLKTEKNSQGCGIGRALMILCLGHEDITEDGGMDPSTYPSEAPGAPPESTVSKEF